MSDEYEEDKMQFAEVFQVDPQIAGPSSQPNRKAHNLGSAIILVAIHDYRTAYQEDLESAREFLYPSTEEARAHFEWAAAQTGSISHHWLREMLDKHRSSWDAERRRKFRTRASDPTIGYRRRHSSKNRKVESFSGESREQRRKAARALIERQAAERIQ